LSAEAEILRAKKDDPEAQKSAAKLEGVVGQLQGAETQAIENVREGTRLRIAGIVESIEALTESKKELEPMQRILDGIEDTLTNGMATAFEDIITGSQSMKEAFLSMGQSVLKILARVIAEMIAVRILQMAISGFTGGLPSLGTPGSSSVNPPTNNSYDFISNPNGQLTARYGGVFSNGRRGYGMGGIANGPQAGYTATLHGTEAVVPLPNNKSIPVDMKGGGQNNNVTVNVAIDGQGNARQDAQADSNEGANLGSAIAAAVQKELQNQKRAGGILNPMGVS